MSGTVAPSVLPQPWWEATEPDVKALAKRLCESGGQDPDWSVTINPPAELCTPMGLANHVSTSSLWPLWVCYVDVARHALLLVRSKPAAAETVAEPQEADIEAVLPKDERPLNPETKWRQETGLDAPRFSD